jgi:isopenicillin-N epimerase
MEKYNWNSVSNNCKKQVLECAPKLFDFLRTTPLAPLNNEFFGQICSAKIQTTEPEKLQRMLFEKYKIEIPVMRHSEDCYIRFSFQVFNEMSEIEYLIQSLSEIKKETTLFSV